MNQAHVDAIRERHARIEAELADELSRPLPDSAVVVALKRRKLSLRDVEERARRT